VHLLSLTSRRGAIDHRHSRDGRPQSALCLQMGAAVFGAGHRGLGGQTGPWAQAAPGSPAGAVRPGRGITPSRRMRHVQAAGWRRSRGGRRHDRGQFAHVTSRLSGRKRQREVMFYVPVNLCERRACSASVAVGLVSAWCLIAIAAAPRDHWRKSQSLPRDPR
jgi:hypothetical protein